MTDLFSTCVWVHELYRHNAENTNHYVRTIDKGRERLPDHISDGGNIVPYSDLRDPPNIELADEGKNGSRLRSAMSIFSPQTEGRILLWDNE